MGRLRPTRVDVELRVVHELHVAAKSNSVDFVGHVGPDAGVVCEDAQQHRIVFLHDNLHLADHLNGEAL